MANATEQRRPYWRRPEAEVAEMVRLRVEGRTLAEIGKIYGITRERVRVIVLRSGAELHACPTCRKSSMPGSECAWCVSESKPERPRDSLRDLIGEARRAHPDDLVSQAKVIMPRSALAWRVAKLWLRGLTHDEIAQQLGTSPGAVGQVVLRLRKSGVPLPWRSKRATVALERLAKGDGAVSKLPAPVSKLSLVGCI